MLLKYRKILFWIVILSGLLLLSLFFYQKYLETNYPCQKFDTLGEDYRVNCWEKVANSLVKKYGLGKAFEMLPVFLQKNPTFGESCHEYLHEVGHGAYRYYLDYKTGKNFQIPKNASSCGYGFYHGLIASVLIQNATVPEAKSFCLYLNDKFGKDAPELLQNCYHGIGHGLAVGSVNWNNPKHEISKQIDKCKPIGEGYETCVSAIFSDISALYFSQVLIKTYPPDTNHSIEDYKNTFDICKYFPEYKNECISSFIFGVDATKDLRPQLNAAFYLTDSDSTSVAIKMIAKTYSRKTSAGRNDSAFNACLDIQDIKFRKLCIEGLISGKLETVETGREMEMGRKYCDDLRVPDEAKNLCNQQLGILIGK